jgi:uridine kinase
VAYLIGVTGGTGAGKTTLVHSLVGRLGGYILDVDSYYRDLSHLSPEARARHNYDEPDAIDTDLLVSHLGCLAGGEPIAKPVYSFENHTRVGTERITPARLIFVDGLFALWWPSLRALLDFKIYVDVPPDLRLGRRIQRDVRERGRDVQSVLAQYFSTVRPMHERYVEPTRPYADLVVTNSGPLEDCLALVLSTIGAGSSGPAPEVGVGSAGPHPPENE